jgi:putative peptidoglycan lipid II flippase
MFKKFLNFQSKNVTLAAVILAVSGILSRLLGVVRDSLLSRNFPASSTDLYFAAFRVPDFVYNVLISGGVIVALLPLFSEYFLKDKKDGWNFINNTLNIFFLFLVVLSGILFLFAAPLMKIVTPGFDAAEMEKVVFFTRILFLSPIFLGLSSIFSGVLQYFNRFLAYSLAPIFYNLGIIFGILFLSPKFGISGVVLGVIFGAFLHLAIQIPSAISCGFRYRPIFRLNGKIKKIFLLMVPRTIGVAAQQLNIIIMTGIASKLSIGSISVFNYSDTLQFFPIGIVGVSFAVAVFPTLTRHWAEMQKEDFIKNFSSAFRQILFLIIPFSVLIFILRSQIVDIIYKRGSFTENLAMLTSASLGLFCFGIFASTLIPLVFRAFFACKDTKTPTFVALISVVLNVFLSFYFVSLLQEGSAISGFLKGAFNLQNVNDISVLGLSMAFSAIYVLQFFLLMFFLHKKIGRLGFREILPSGVKIISASILMAAIVILTRNLFIDFASGGFLGLFWKTGTVAVFGAVVYLLLTYLFKSPEVLLFLKKVRKSSAG